MSMVKGSRFLAIFTPAALCYLCGMADIGHILSLVSQAGSGLLTATQIADNLKKVFSSEEPDIAASKQAVLELLDKLLDAKRDQIAVESLLSELKKDLDKADRFAQEAARYQLTQTDMGGRVYALKADDTSGEPPHEICASCYDEGKKSILQFSTKQMNTLVCHRCNATALKSDGRESAAYVVSTARTPWDIF
ncbi:hypothetical protein ACUXV3_12465 [Roseobacteraceae bacterium NS-SX3]